MTGSLLHFPPPMPYFFIYELIIFLSFLFFFFLLWTIFKVFVEFVSVLLLFYVLVFWPQGI